MDGRRFPSKIIDILLSGLKCHMKQLNPEAVDILSEKDPKFTGLRGVRDTVARELRKDGIGATVKHTDVFTFEVENHLWETAWMLIHQKGC